MRYASVLGIHGRQDGYLEGRGYLISWCFGHLWGLADAVAYDPKYKKWNQNDLPILPTTWQYQLLPGSQKQMALLRRLMDREDVTEIVNACDPGREGELIFRNVYNLAQCTKPMLRLWVSSMEDEAIREGFAHLRPGLAFNGVYEAALCRAQADWLVGINATRLFSTAYHRTLVIGRVISPTLSMVVNREQEIAGHKSETFYRVCLTCEGVVFQSEKLDQAQAEALAAQCAGQTAVVEELRETEQVRTAPALLDLTALQRLANKQLGYTAQQADNYLAVYAYEEGGIEAILAEPCGQYIIEDITGTGYEDLVVMDTDETGAAQIKLLTADRENGGFRQAAVLGLSPDRFTGCASLAAGMGAYGGQYLVLDGWTGVSGANLASVLLRYNEKSQQMEPARQIGADELYEASLRYVPDLTSRDLDRDGVVEIPTQPEEAGLINMGQSRRMDFILWMDYTSAQPRKSFGILDEELGFYLELPMEWYGSLMLTDGEEENEVQLCSRDGQQLYLRLHITDVSDRRAGWTRLGVVSGRLVQAQFGPDAAIADPLYRLSRSVYIL